MRKEIEGNIVDIYNRNIFPGIVSIEDGRIIAIARSTKQYDRYILPGFIDAHVHIESSMLVPAEFSELVIQKGTIAVINDPHEIANVLGKEGIYFMLENSRSSLIKMFFTIPSCVPATDYDFSGSRLSVDDIKELLKSGRFVGLSEMMNVPGVLKHCPEVMRKIEIVRKQQLPIDGHAPGVRGMDLLKYVQAGISTDHECVDLEEALEKLNAGLKILIREGSAAKNYKALKSLISSHTDQVMYCTDDSHPDDIIRTGHIDKIVKRAVCDGFELFDILKVACINPVEHYHLPVGTLRINDPADFIVVRDLKSFDVLSVYLSGEDKFRYVKNRQESFTSAVCLNNFSRTPILPSDLKKNAGERNLCIGVKNGEIVTTKEFFQLSAPKQDFQSDTDKDILKIVYLNRYQNTPPQIAYIRGIGLKEGAFATSISHDSHNIIAVGCSDLELTSAINAVIAGKGGLSVAGKDGISVLPLPVAGIMTDKKGMEVAEIWERMMEKLHRMGCCLDSPFMTLSFMSLIVIPELKIGERGLFDYNKFDFISE